MWENFRPHFWPYCTDVLQMLMLLACQWFIFLCSSSSLSLSLQHWWRLPAVCSSITEDSRWSTYFKLLLEVGKIIIGSSSCKKQLDTHCFSRIHLFGSLEYPSKFWWFRADNLSLTILSLSMDLLLTCEPDLGQYFIWRIGQLFSLLFICRLSRSDHLNLLDHMSLSPLNCSHKKSFQGRRRVRILDNSINVKWLLLLQRTISN